MRQSSMRRVTNAATMAYLAAVVMLAAAGSAPAQELFPQPFLVEHQLIQTDPDGEVFAADPVIDHYGRSMIVSQRTDGSRNIIDLAARTITEISPERGTYTVLTFDQLADLRLRLWQAEMRQVNPARLAEMTEKRVRGPATEPSFRLERQPVLAGIEGEERGGELVQRSGVEHVRVLLAESSAKTESQVEALAVDVWLDPSIRMSEAGQEALTRFEREVLSGIEADDEVPPARYVTAAREQAGGAIPIRTRRPSSAEAALAGDASVIENVVIRLEPLEELSAELTTVPEGYRRTLHTLEQLVAYAEEQAELFERASQTGEHE